MFKKIILVFAILIVAGISGIYGDRYLFPYLATTSLFSKYQFLKKATNNVTVINKTEKVYVKEDSSIKGIANQTVASIVNIISYPSNNQKKNIILRSRKKEANFKNGTGEIVTSDGIIMTYISAINPKNSNYKILTSDGNSYDGKLLEVDSWSNLAFIKINTSNLPVVAFGNFKNYSSGRKVIAIGNNMVRYQNSFSLGILNSFNPTFNISGQSLSSSEKLEGVFLTDFSQGSLSVGGPIIDYSGKIIGVTGAITINGKTTYFEIPSNKVELVLDKVINKEVKTNPILGIYYVSLSKSYALANNLSQDHGALIYSKSGQQGLAVISGTPAFKSGLKIRDIITKANGQDINLDHNLSDVLYSFKKGDKIELTVLRNGKEIKIEVQL